MGAVWLAHDGLRHGDVVLRAIPWAPPADDEEQESRRERLLNEARALARLDHPNIVRVLNVAEDDGRPWMVFQATPYRFPHRPLSDVVRNDGPLRPDQAAEVGLQVLAAVREAHTVGVLHRDIKPGSILLGPGNRVLLADFGMVTADGSPAMTTLEALTGSPLYMAPERASGKPATPRVGPVVTGGCAVRGGGGTGALRSRRHGSRAHRRHERLPRPATTSGPAVAGAQRAAPQGPRRAPRRRCRGLAVPAGGRWARPAVAGAGGR